MDIQNGLDNAKVWTNSKSHDLKDLLSKFGDIDLSLKSNFSSSAKRAYVEILIMLDDKIKYLTDLGRAIERVSSITSTLDEKIRVKEIFANAIGDIENTIDICSKIVNSSPHLLQENLCIHYIELISSQRVFKENRENLYLFLLL